MKKNVFAVLVCLAIVSCQKDFKNPQDQILFGNEGGANVITPVRIPDVSNETMIRFQQLLKGEVSSRSSADYTAQEAADIAEGLLNSDYAYVDMDYDDFDERNVTVNFAFDPELVSENEVLEIRDTALAIWVEHYNDVFTSATSKEGYFIDITVHSQSVSSFILNINTSIVTNPVIGVAPTLSLTNDHYSWNESTRNCDNVTSPSSVHKINGHIAPFIKSRLPRRIEAYPRWYHKGLTIDPTIYPNPNDVTSFDNELDFLMFHYCECDNYT